MSQSQDDRFSLTLTPTRPRRGGPTWLALTALAALALLGSTADAQTAPPIVVVEPAGPTPAPLPTAGAPDSVVLRGGGLLRGRLQEILPGVHVRVLLEPNEIRVVPWSEVGRVFVASSAPGGHTVAAKPGEAAAPPPAPSPPPPPKKGPLAWVHVKSPKFVLLNRREGPGAPWVHACDAPCDTELPLGDDYEIAGLGRGPTDPFNLQGAAGDHIVLTVAPPSGTGKAFSGLLAVTGGLALYVGTLVALSSAGCDGSYGGGDCGKSAGFATMGVGAAGLALGLYLFHLSARTDHSQQAPGIEHEPAPADPTLRFGPREPRDRAAASTGGPGVVLPVFSRSF